MKYLMDTHIFIWWILDSPRLTKDTKDILRSSCNSLWFSMASIWEIIIKSSVSKIILPESPESFIRKQMEINSVVLLDIQTDHVFELLKLPMIHKDPFDRMLIAQSRIEQMTLITEDNLIRQYNVEVF